MTVVGVTGSNGFFGWHLRCRLFTFGWETKVADRSTFANTDMLDEFVSACDVVVHLAGVNRANSEDEIVSGNRELADALVDARARTDAKFDVIFANSAKIELPGIYGEAKDHASQILAADAKQAGVRLVDVVFPHLYGEFGIPFYNSAVTTFAHQLAKGEESQVNDGQLELLHIQDACELIIESVTNGSSGRIRPTGTEITVPACHELMTSLAAPYVHSGTLPHIAEDHLELRLFNTIRSQMWPDAYPMKLTRHADHRGAFFEVVRAWGQGQTSISTTVPGVVRGEHYHLNKVERFAVISGQAQIRVRRLFTNDTYRYDVTGSEPVFIDMPPLCTHDITNTGSDELVTLFWSHDHFDPANGDTYPLKVVGEDLPA